MRPQTIVLPALVLGAALLLQSRGLFETDPDAPKVVLRALLAAPVPGWAAKDLPIGETEMIRDTAAKALRYDDYFYRSYRRGDTEFTVYVAYWGPGKQPPQMITQHTPDRCWPMTGMTCEEMRFNVPAAIGSRSLWPAQWRKFRAPDGSITYTMFWHMVGMRPYDFGERFYDMPGPLTYWSEAMRFAVGGRPDQRFFRITSNVPPEQIWQDPGFQQAIHGFLQLGLGQRGT